MDRTELPFSAASGQDLLEQLSLSREESFDSITTNQDANLAVPVRVLNQKEESDFINAQKMK